MGAPANCEEVTRAAQLAASECRCSLSRVRRTLPWDVLGPGSSVRTSSDIYRPTPLNRHSPRSTISVVSCTMNSNRQGLFRARAAIYCMAREDIIDPDPTSRSSYHECMCGSGVTSYCDRIAGVGAEGLEERLTTTATPRSDAGFAWFEGSRNSATETAWYADSEGNLLPKVNNLSLEGGSVWFGILVALVFFICLAFRCCGEEEEQSSSSQRTQRTR